MLAPRNRTEIFVRLIAVERFARGVVLLVAGIYLVGHTGTNFGSLANRVARAIEIDPHRPFVRHLIDRLGRLRRHQVLIFGIGALSYGAVELVEGVGLWLEKRWAEWLTVIATAALIPLELYEVVRHPTVLKGGGLIVNLVVVIYLYRVVHRKGRAAAT